MNLLTNDEDVAFRKLSGLCTCCGAPYCNDYYECIRRCILMQPSLIDGPTESWAMSFNHDNVNMSSIPKWVTQYVQLTMVASKYDDVPSDTVDLRNYTWVYEVVYTKVLHTVRSIIVDNQKY